LRCREEVCYREPGGAQMRNVLHLVEHLYQGGIERLLEQLARSTPRQSQSLHFFTYQTKQLAGIGKELAEHGTPVYTYDKGKGYDLELLRRLVDVVKTQKIDVVHTHDFGPTEYAVALKIRFPRLRLIHTHHTVHDFLRHRKYVLFFRFAVLFYSRVVGVSDYVTGILRRLCPHARYKILTVSNGLDVESFQRQPRPIASGALRLVNVSRISAEKNLLHLLRACTKLREAGIPFELHHAGSGNAEEEDRVRGYVKSNGLEGHVFFAGFQSDVRPTLAKGDIFVSSSTTEGHPVAVLEAMAAGLLCLCSDIPAHRILSKDGILLFGLDEDSLFQLLRRVHAEPDAYRDVAARARLQVKERFSLERMIASYGRVYA
jgi:glycosyltransferase involved in cell wall biosynthesis